MARRMVYETLRPMAHIVEHIVEHIAEGTHSPKDRSLPWGSRKGFEPPRPMPPMPRGCASRGP